MNKVGLICIVFLLSGCMGASMPNEIRQASSKFDGSTEYTMDPGFVYRGEETFAGADFKLGLHWSSAAPDAVVVKAAIPNMIINIASNKGLQFNIDGDVVKLSSTQATTDFQSDVSSGVVFKESSKRFVISREMLDKLCSSRTVMAKLVTSDGYFEGEITIDRMSSAIRGFRDFRDQLPRVSALRD